MTYIIKNILSRYHNQSVFNRFLGANILALTLLIGGSSSAWAQTVTATWDWEHTVPSDIRTFSTAQYNTETETLSLNSDQSGIVLDVDASQVASAKFEKNGDNVHVNPGTVISVPVQSANDVVFVKNYPGYTYYTVGGQAPQDNKVVHFVTSAEATAGHVLIEVSDQVYFYAITVIQNENTPDAYIAKWDWHNGTPAALSSTVIQSKMAGLASNINGVSIAVDANPGKLQNDGSGNGMLNKGTVLYIPIKKAGDVVTLKFNAYNGTWANTKVNGGSACSVNDIGGINTFVYNVNETDASRGYITIEATDVVYLYEIDLLSKHAFREFELDFTGTGNANAIRSSLNLEGNASDFGITFNAGGNPISCDPGYEISGQAYNGGSDNGLYFYSNSQFISFDVNGPVKITLGKTTSSTTATISSSAGLSGREISLLSSGTSYTTANPVTTEYNYKGGAATITIRGGNYIPYLKVENYEIPPFNEFDIDLTVETPVVPTGVTPIIYEGRELADTKKNGSQHGWEWYAVKFDVDGPVDIFLGGCSSINSGYEAYLVGEDGVKISTINNREIGCSGLVRYRYTGGAQELKLYCGEYCPYIKVIKPKTEGYYAKWDWKTMGPSSELNKTISSTLKWLPSDVPGISMYVGTSGGTYRANGSNVQLSKDSKLIIPVYGENDRLTVEGYPAYINYSVNGRNYTTNLINYKVTSENVAKGYIEIVSTDDDRCYFNSVKMRHLAETDVVPSFVAEWNWKSPQPSDIATVQNAMLNSCVNGLSNSDCQLDVQGTMGYFEGKDNVEIANNTTIKIPVYAVNDMISFWFHSYQASYNHIFINGSPTAIGKQQYVYTATEDDADRGYVTLTTNANVYLYSLKLIHSNMSQFADITLDSQLRTAGRFAVGKNYVSVDGSTVSIDDVAPSAGFNAVVTSGGDNGHGIVNSTVEIPLPVGQYEITIGKCNYPEGKTNNFILKVGNEDAENITTVEAGKCYEVTNDIVSKTFTLLEPTLVGVSTNESTGSYLPFFSIVKTADVNPSTTVFELDFTKSGDARLISGRLPAGTEVVGTVYGDGSHGSKGVKVTFPVTKPSIITVGGCDYDDASDVATLKVKDAVGNIASINTKKVGCNGRAMFYYSGGAAMLELTGGQYCNYVALENVTDNMTFEENYSVYNAKVSNVQQLRKALAVADGNTNYKIFLENGTYDLGEKFGTFVKDNVTLVGQSRDGVVIKNTPANEGIWTSATLLTGSNVIMQNLTLRCTVTQVGGNERGTALYDNGSGNVYKNIRLLGRQDTYYSHDNATSFFEDCEIHGTVDFICGSGNVWFEKCDLLIESSSEAYITAARKNNTPGEYNGYIFNECTIDNADGADMAGKYYLGRAWDNQAKVSYYKTTKVIAPHTDKWTVMSGGAHVESIDSENSPSNPKTSPVTYKPAPASLTLNNGVLTWTAVEGASAYAIFKGNAIIAVVDAEELSYSVGSQSSAKGFGRHKAASISDKKYSVAAIDANGIIGELATDREVAALDAAYYYDFRLDDFDFDDHEVLTKIGESNQCSDHKHGWEFSNGTGFSVQLIGNGRVEIARCSESGGNFTVTSDNGGTITPNMFSAKDARDGKTITINYEGPATTLNFVSDATNYVHSVRVTNDGAVAIKFEDTKDRVTIHNNVPGAYVYYTIDGTEPTTTNYKERFSEASHVVPVKDCWVKAICVMDGEVIHSVARFCRSTFAGFSWDFSNGSTLLGSETTEFSTGVVIDDRGETYLVPEGDLSSSIDITTSYHDKDHGYLGIIATVPVEGPVIVTIGNCQYGKGKIIIKTAEGASVSLDPSAAKNCYHQNKTENFVRYEYTGGPTVLTIVGETGKTVYIPYLSVRDASATRVKFVNRYPKTLLGTVPDEVEVNEAHQAFIPYNTTLYREGWAVTGWEDSETGTKYELGRSYTFYNNTTLYPVITKCTKAITDTNEPFEVTWPFDQLDGAPRFTLHNSNSDPTTMTYVKCVNVEGSMVDVPLVLDATNNKIDNNDDRVNALAGHGGQFNDNTAIRVPAVYGMTITLNASEKNDKLYDTTTKFSGENCAVVKLRDGENFITGVVSDDGKSVTFTYNGDSPTIDVFIEKSGSGSTWGFFHSLSVTYPVLPNVVLANVITNADAEAFPNEDPANAGEATVTLQSAGASHTNTGSRFRVGDVIKLQSKAEYGYELAGFRKRVSEGDPETITYTGPTTLDDGSTVITAEFTVVDEGITTIEALFTRREDLVKVTATSADITMGNVSLSPKYSNLYNKLENGVTAYYVPNTAVSVSAEAEKDYVIAKWVDGETETFGRNVYSFTATTPKSIVAYFKEGANGTVIFDLTGTGVDVDPNTFNGALSRTPERLEGVKSFYVPNNYTFFKDQHTLTHWEDGSGRKYEPGKYYSFDTEGQTITLKPEFVHNIADKENRTRGDALYWDFRTANLMQEIDVEANQDFFWTSKVSVQVIENGERRDHTRDVALWIHTNSEGFVRNNDLPEWVTFGPGTKIDIPSCAGATLKMYTYSEITSTTFDGHIPVIDEEATREIREQGEVGYVYTYTTSNPNARVSIVIGDDNSYYKWVRCYSLPANRVELHADVDDDVRGEIVDIRGKGEFEAEELADGGFSFQKGNLVYLTFRRKFGYEFDRIVDPDKKDADGTDFSMIELVKDKTTGVITGVQMVTSEGYTYEAAKWNEEKGAWVGQSTSITFRQLPAEEGQLDTYEVQFEISDHRAMEIRFEPRSTYYVTFSAGEFASGVAPEPVWVEAGDKFTIPKNKTLFYNDHTLKAWKDEDNNTYTLGAEYTAPAKDLRLRPVFVENTFTVLDITTDSKVTWELTKKKGAPNLEYERSSGILVSQLYMGTDFIDLKIDLNASDKDDNGKLVYGKINNMAYDDRCQINEYSSITFAAIRDCVIELEALENLPTEVKISGATHDPAKTISYTHEIGHTLHSVEFGVANDRNYSTWCTALSITYKPIVASLPQLSSVTVGGTSISADQLTSLKDDKQITVTFVVGANDAFPAVEAAADNGLTEIVQANLSTRKAEIHLVSRGGLTIDTYTINFNAIVNSEPDLTGSPSIYVNTIGYNAEVIPLDQPIDGTIRINFNRTMSAVESSSNIKLRYEDEPVGDALVASQGSTLIFRYWNLEVNKQYTLTIPANTLRDVYNANYSSDITVTFKTAKDIIPVEHRKFNWIVGVDGTLSEGITAANNTGGLARFYIFVPDGEYELQGNDNIRPTLNEDATTLYDDEGRYRSDLLDANLNNKKTRLSRANVSIIGQSQTGTKIYNHPVIEGIDYTATLYLPASATDFYAQDLTIENRFNYRRSMSNAQNNAARAVALQGHGSRMILKNVSLWSYQDTYYSSVDADPHFCSYLENCSVAGVVDWVCGGGNIWLEKCDLIHRDRAGNNLAAPHTNTDQKWGLVFNDCTIKPEVEVGSLQYMTAKDWTLARPWGTAPDQSPACTFINTTMNPLPRDAGWGIMYGGMVLRLHEYKTTDASGNLVSLANRSLAACAPAVGSDDCILSAAEASSYKVNEVLEFNPAVYTAQRSAVQNLAIEDGVLEWTASADNMDLCYFIFKKDADGNWKYFANVAETKFDFNLYGADIREGIFMVRAANQRGGLGAPSEEIEYDEVEKFDLTITEVGQTLDKGWATICLPNNAKVPEGEIKVYAAVTINDNTITLKSVKYITANVGYVVYGDVGTYTFRGSSHTAEHESYLSGNPSDAKVSASSTNCYTLAYKPNVSGIGFYKYSGTWLNPYKAYLEVEVFKRENTSSAKSEETLDKALSKGIRFVFAPDEEATDLPLLDLDALLNYKTDAIYDLSGRRVITPVPGRIYIINGAPTLWE